MLVPLDKIYQMISSPDLANVKVGLFYIKEQVNELSYEEMGWIAHLLTVYELKNLPDKIWKAYRNLLKECNIDNYELNTPDHIKYYKEKIRENKKNKVGLYLDHERFLYET